MPKRKRGGQPGNQNAIKHGRHSAPVRAARRAAVQAFYEESRRKSDEWAKMCPATDYDAIVDGLRELKRRKAGGAYRAED
jgi:hypothetical protein